MSRHQDLSGSRLRRWTSPTAWWRYLEMDTESLLMMMKGSLAPTIVIAISQSHAISDVTTTTGYLAALIAVSAQCLQPRAKFIKVMFFCLLSLCVTASITCLAIYSAVKARHPSNNATPDQYDSSASAVAAIWLFVMIWVGNALRAWRMAELQDPIVTSSIFALVALTRAGNWTTVDEGLDFVVRLIKTFLIGFAIPTGVSLLILPRTCRQGVCKDIRNFVHETNAVLHALTEFVNTASRTSFLTRQKTHIVSEDDVSSQDDNELPSEVRFAKARSRLTKASDTLNTLDAKIQAGLKYSRNEVAWGKLSAADLDEISMLLRGVLLPLSGMSLLPDIVNSFTEAEPRVHPTDDGLTIEGQGPIDHGIIDALSECLGDTQTLVSTGLQYFLLQLELAGTGTKKPSDSEACTEESMPRELDPSSSDFVSAFGLKIHEMSVAKQNLRADKFLVQTSTPPSQHASDDGTSETTQRIDRDMIIQQDFLLVLYLFSLQTMVLDATLNLIRFAKRKTDDNTMKQSRLIIPAGLHPKRSHIASSTTKEAPAQPNERRDTAREVQGLEVVDLVHLKPANFLERGSDWFRSVSHLIGSDLSMFGLRVAAASLSIGIVAFLRQSHDFFIHQRGVWAMIVVVIGMSPTSGQSFFGFFARILATAASVALSLAAWYIVVGKTAGVIIFLYLANVIEFYTYVKKPHLFGPSIIAIVTLNIIIAYELQVKAIGSDVAESNGQPYYPIYLFGPYKLAAVAVGCAVSFFWTIFPYPITAKSNVPRLAGGSLFNLARFYSAMHTAVDRWIHQDQDQQGPRVLGQEDDRLHGVLRDLYKQELLALNGLRMHNHFATYEPPIGGKFPSAIYAKLTAGMQRILTIMSLMAHIAQTMPAPSFQQLEDATEPSDLPSSQLAVAWASTGFQFQSTTSLFCHLASSLTHAKPLPPFLTASESFPLVRHLHKINSEMLQTQNSYQPAYTALISLELLRTALSLELQKQLDEIRVLVGEIMFHV
ncbi:hypothetical protein BGZ61DRAFT_105508 [Ilyonectria robusta]|uniref:uncharacterized protein n=1 Tax=Ilyonectria robusta TaxID=1079257 RepID=UPI001E8EBD82|nr:uncharacterized protein BGZ61DRAFT_105508 [Ilyonectria robusta]KAH8672385.1 hypothetical protein BGZ61DRAFT_105508 [Ilyonectria robusta]